MLRKALGAVLAGALLAPALALAPGLAHAAEGAPIGRATTGPLPDWSGVWGMQGGTIFDRATAEPANAQAGQPGARERPPYNAAWEAKYLANIERVRQDRFPDVITNCGVPIGFPRILNAPDGYEFVVTPKQTWILTENGPNVMRIYTDGRQHLGPDDIWPTYTGDSVGHWEGDTLVFSTIGIKGETGSIVDRTGIVISDKATGLTRMRKIDDNTLEAQITITDPVAFTKPWVVTKRFRKMTQGDVRIMDYACAENNRNPVDVATGKTLTLDAAGKAIDIDR
jgi:hypothetical protein